MLLFIQNSDQPDRFHFQPGFLPDLLGGHLAGIIRS